MMRVVMSRTIELPPPVPTVNPLLPKLDPVALKLMTGGGGPVGVAPPVVGALAPLTATCSSPAPRMTPGTPTSVMPFALARSAK